MAKITKPKIAIIIALAVILLLALAAVFVIWKYGKPGNAPAVETLTQEEIEKALSKKAETPGTPLSEKEIDQALGKKVPLGQKLAPLTQEEIQKALQAK